MLATVVEIEALAQAAVGREAPYARGQQRVIGERCRARIIVIGRIVYDLAHFVRVINIDMGLDEYLDDNNDERVEFEEIVAEITPDMETYG